MIWGSFWRDDDSIKAEAFRRVHERWLSEAVRRPEAYPRIPVRRVADGGYSRLMSRPAGRRAVERWWRKVLASPLLDVRSR